MGKSENEDVHGPSEFEAYFRANADGFDERFGVETEKLLPAINYGAIRTSVFDEIWDLLRLDASEYVFVDIGAAKGKALLLAAMRPFRRIIGVEIDRDCSAIAQRNIAAVARSIQGINRIEVAEMDAFEWVVQKWPSHPNVFLLMYCPFMNHQHVPYLRFFVLLVDSVRVAKTKLTLAFVNPLPGVEELLLSLGFSKSGQSHHHPQGDLASILYSWKTFSINSPS